MRYKVLTDGNGSKLIRVVGLGDYLPVKDVVDTEAERDALAAHNSELVSACKLAIDMFVANDCNVPNTIETLQDAIDATPQQCLRDVQAEAGRKGFIECSTRWNLCNAFGEFVLPEELEAVADEYAATVRQGGE